MKGSEEKKGVKRVDRASKSDLESWKEGFMGRRNWRKGSRGEKKG